jgi:methylase of polypeptide subunit release factors
MEEALDPGERFALVIADPPWVRSHETSEHPGDPLSAIDGGDDGLDAVRTCLAVIGRHLLPGGAALLQVGGPGQAEAVAEHVVRHRDLGLAVVDHAAVDGGALVRLARGGVARYAAG